MALEEIWDRRGVVAPLRVSRNTTLGQANDWLDPALREQLTFGDGVDWWAPLRIELLLQGARWLDLLSYDLPDLQREGVRIKSWRPHWWEEAGRSVFGPTSRRGSLLATLEALRSPARGEVLKTYGHDLLVRRYSDLSTTRNRLAASSSGLGLLFVGEIPSPSMTESLLVSARPADLVLTADPRFFRRARAAGHTVESLWWHRASPHADGVGALPTRKQIEKEISVRLARVDSRFARIASLPAARALRQLMVDGQRLEAAIVKHRPRAVVVASDQHRYGVLACRAARRLAVPSVVLQHGVVADPVGYTPPRATHYAVFGNSSRRFFISAGVPDSRVHIVGFPRFIGNTGGRQVRDAILVPLQPENDAGQREVIALAVAIAAKRQDLRVILRPHPGDSAMRGLSTHQLLDRLAWPPQVPVDIDLEADPDHALARCGAVLTFESTFSLDAAVRGLPVVLAGGGRRSSLEAAEWPRVSTVEELERVLSDSPALHASAAEVVAYGGRDAVERVWALLDSLVGGAEGSGSATGGTP